MAYVYKEIRKNKIKSVVLLSVFIVMIGFIGLALGMATGGEPYGGLIAAGAFAMVYALIGYFAGSKMALAVSGAKRIDRSSLPQVYNMVDNLCITAGLPVPEIYIINSPALNAFATGRNPEKSAIALTRGIVETLDKRELEAVIAHELSHIGNYDIRLSMLVVALVGAVSIISDIGIRMVFYNGGGKRDGRAQLAMLAISIFLVGLSPLIALMLQMSISRKREYLADASGALLTRNPNALADALEKIAGKSQLQQATKGTAHLYIGNPLKKGFFGKMFATHPPIEERIKVLREMG